MWKEPGWHETVSLGQVWQDDSVIRDVEKAGSAILEGGSVCVGFFLDAAEGYWDLASQVLRPKHVLNLPLFPHRKNHFVDFRMICYLNVVEALTAGLVSAVCDVSFCVRAQARLDCVSEGDGWDKLFFSSGKQRTDATDREIILGGA